MENIITRVNHLNQKLKQHSQSEICNSQLNPSKQFKSIHSKYIEDITNQSKHTEKHKAIINKCKATQTIRIAHH